MNPAIIQRAYSDPFLYAMLKNIQAGQSEQAAMEGCLLAMSLANQELHSKLAQCVSGTTPPIVIRLR